MIANNGTPNHPRSLLLPELAPEGISKAGEEKAGKIG